MWCEGQFHTLTRQNPSHLPEPSHLMSSHRQVSSLWSTLGLTYLLPVTLPLPSTALFLNLCLPPSSSKTTSGHAAHRGLAQRLPFPLLSRHTSRPCDTRWRTAILFLGCGGTRHQRMRFNEGNASSLTNLDSGGTEQPQGTRDCHDMTVIDLQHRGKKSLRGLKEKGDTGFRTDTSSFI